MHLFSLYQKLNQDRLRKDKVLWPPQQNQEECGEKANTTFDNAQTIPQCASEVQKGQIFGADKQRPGDWRTGKVMAPLI